MSLSKIAHASGAGFWRCVDPPAHGGFHRFEDVVKAMQVEDLLPFRKKLQEADDVAIT